MNPVYRNSTTMRVGYLFPPDGQLFKEIYTRLRAMSELDAICCIISGISNFKSAFVVEVVISLTSVDVALFLLFKFNFGFLQHEKLMYAHLNTSLNPLC
jgi:hypothetical protein